VVELPQAPLNFQEKQQIWTRHGVPIDKVVEVKDPIKAAEITKKFGMDRTAGIFAMTNSSANQVLTSNKGYFEKYSADNKKLEPLTKKAYVLIIPDEVVTVNQFLTPQIIRRGFASKAMPTERKKSFFQQVFGWYDISLFDLVQKRFAEANTVSERINESAIVRRLLKPIVKEILGELTEPMADPNIDTETGIQTTSPGEAAKLARLKKDAAQKHVKMIKTQLDLTKKKAENEKRQSMVTTHDLTDKLSVAKKQI
jgi:hypothetical protein